MGDPNHERTGAVAAPRPERPRCPRGRLGAELGEAALGDPDVLAVEGLHEVFVRLRARAVAAAAAKREREREILCLKLYSESEPSYLNVGTVCII